MSDTCSSRRFSRLIKSCFPNQNDASSLDHTLHALPRATAISSLPDDVLLDCLSRVPHSSLPSVSLVCRRWSRLLDSSCFSDLRRRLGLLSDSIFAFSAVDGGLFSASLGLVNDSAWKVSFFLPDDAAASPANFRGLLSHARLCAIGPRIYIIGRSAVVKYDTWTGAVTARSPMIYTRKKFAAAVVAGRIYVAGGGSRTANAVEEYDPETDAWSVVAHAPRRRYGCIGASVDGVFYVIGGLKIGGASGSEFSRAAAGGEAHVYASSMDLYDAEARGWMRSRSVPGGGCVVAACAAVGHVYVLASHAVELSFWRFNARRKGQARGTAAGGGGGFGEWSRMKSPPLPAQVRLDSTVRFCCVGVGDKVVLIQVIGCIDDLLRRSGRSVRGLRGGLVLVYDTAAEEWSRGVDLPEVVRRAGCLSVEC